MKRLLLVILLSICSITAISAENEIVKNISSGAQLDKNQLCTINDNIPNIVATIDGIEITKSNFINFIKRHPFLPNKMPTNAVKDLQRSILELLIDHLFLIKMAKEKGIYPSRDLTAAEFDRMISQLAPGQIESLRNKLKKLHLSLEEYREKVSSDRHNQEIVAISVWRRNFIAPKIKIPRRYIREFYLNNKGLFDQTQSVNISHILIKPVLDVNEQDMKLEAVKNENKNTGTDNSTKKFMTDAEIVDMKISKLKEKYSHLIDKSEAKAQLKAIKILEEIRNKKISFEEMAYKYSDCPSGRKSGGYLGKFKKGALIKEIDESAFKTTPGNVNGPIKTKFGFHLIKVHKTGKTGELSLKVLYPQIKKYILNKREQKIVDQILEKEKSSRRIIRYF